MVGGRCDVDVGAEIDRDVSGRRISAGAALGMGLDAELRARYRGVGGLIDRDVAVSEVVGVDSDAGSRSHGDIGGVVDDHGAVDIGDGRTIAAVEPCSDARWRVSTVVHNVAGTDRSGAVDGNKRSNQCGGLVLHRVDAGTAGIDDIAAGCGDGNTSLTPRPPLRYRTVLCLSSRSQRSAR